MLARLGSSCHTAGLVQLALLVAVLERCQRRKESLRKVPILPHAAL
jgi:hypothetical protein